MNENRTQRKILAVLVAASVVVPLAVEARGEEALGRRYTDPVNGFSLRPPLDAERVRQTSPALLVSWRKRDPDRNAVLRTLSVLRAVEKRPMGDLGTYSKALADKLPKTIKNSVCLTHCILTSFRIYFRLPLTKKRITHESADRHRLSVLSVSRLLPRRISPTFR